MQGDLFPALRPALAPTKAWLTLWDENLARRSLPRLNQNECKILAKNLTHLQNPEELIQAWFQSHFGHETGFAPKAFIYHQRALLLRLRGQGPRSKNQQAFARVAQRWGWSDKA